MGFADATRLLLAEALGVDDLLTLARRGNSSMAADLTFVTAKS
ncbi:MAG TPA: hypothetical protein VF100_12530 [Thermoanaerobaculia bacterium]